VTSPTAPPSGPGGGATANPRVFAAVVIVEALAIAALYWLGRHFA
jgi:hypothetical protein